MRNRMYKHENIAEIKILLNPFTYNSKNKWKQHSQQSSEADCSFIRPSIRLSSPSPSQSKGWHSRKHVIHLKVKIAHARTPAVHGGTGWFFSAYGFTPEDRSPSNNCVQLLALRVPGTLGYHQLGEVWASASSSPNVPSAWDALLCLLFLLLLLLFFFLLLRAESSLQLQFLCSQTKPLSISLKT